MTKVLIIMLLLSTIYAENASLCKKGWNETLLKRYDSAIKLLNECIKHGDLRKRSLAQAYRNIGITYNKSGNYIEAIKSYDMALKYNPTNKFIRLYK